MQYTSLSISMTIRYTLYYMARLPPPPHPGIDSFRPSLCWTTRYWLWLATLRWRYSISWLNRYTYTRKEGGGALRELSMHDGGPTRPYPPWSDHQSALALPVEDQRLLAIVNRLPAHLQRVCFAQSLFAWAPRSGNELVKCFIPRLST